MTVRLILYLGVVISLAGCGPKDVTSTDEPLLAGMEEEGVNGFEPYKNQAVVLPGIIRVFDNSTKSIGQFSIDAITPVEILEKTKSMYSLVDTTVQCAGANFLKIKHNDHQHTVFGADVYELVTDQLQSISDQGSPKYEVFPVRHFEVYSKVMEGGQACDGYSLLMVKRLEDQRYSLVANANAYPNVSSGGKPENNKYAQLLDDYGATERITASFLVNDSISVKISAMYRQSSRTYSLAIKFDQDLCKATIHEEKNPEEIVTSQDLTLDFDTYETEGIVLPEPVFFYSPRGDKLKDILDSDEPTSVTIKGKTTAMYSLNGTDNQCSQSNFVSILRGETNSILFGQDVYEVEGQKFSFANDLGTQFELFTAKNFGIGASDENGLTGCTEESYLVIRRILDQRLSLIENVSSETDGPYFALASSSGIGEKIEQVTFRNDSVAVDVKVSYQDGGGSYRLLVALGDKVSKARITKRKGPE